MLGKPMPKYYCGIAKLVRQRFLVPLRVGSSPATAIWPQFQGVFLRPVAKLVAKFSDCHFLLHLLFCAPMELQVLFF